MIVARWSSRGEFFFFRLYNYIIMCISGYIWRSFSSFSTALNRMVVLDVHPLREVPSFNLVVVLVRD